MNKRLIGICVGIGLLWSYNVFQEIQYKKELKKYNEARSNIDDIINKIDEELNK